MWGVPGWIYVTNYNCNSHGHIDSDDVTDDNDHSHHDPDDDRLHWSC